MRLARENRDRPAVVAAAMVAAAVDTAVVAKVVVASEEATRNSLVPIAFVTTASSPAVAGVAVRTRDCARTHRGGYNGINVLTKIWAGLDSNQRRRKASRFTVCPVWPLRYLPVCTTKAFGVHIARTLPLASHLANARRVS